MTKDRKIVIKIEEEDKLGIILEELLNVYNKNVSKLSNYEAMAVVNAFRLAVERNIDLDRDE